MDSWSIRWRLAAGFGSIVALLLVMAGVVFYGEQRQTETSRQLTQLVMPRADAASEVARSYLLQATATRDYARSGDSQHLEAYYRAVDEAGSAVTRLDSIWRTERGEALFREMQPLAAQYLRAT